MENQYFLIDDSKLFKGPFTLLELRQKNLRPDTLACVKYKPLRYAKDFLELADLFIAEPDPSPTQPEPVADPSPPAPQPRLGLPKPPVSLHYKKSSLLFGIVAVFFVAILAIQTCRDRIKRREEMIEQLQTDIKSRKQEKSKRIKEKVDFDKALVHLSRDSSRLDSIVQSRPNLNMPSLERDSLEEYKKQSPKLRDTIKYLDVLIKRDIIVIDSLQRILDQQNHK